MMAVGDRRPALLAAPQAVEALLPHQPRDAFPADPSVAVDALRALVHALGASKRFIVLGPGTLDGGGCTTPGRVSGDPGAPRLFGRGGQYFSLAARSNGTVWAWGRNSGGQLGDGTTVDRASPVQGAGLTEALELAGGWDHSLALRADGTVWAWGANYSGPLGNGTMAPSLTATQVPGLAGIVAIRANYAQSFAVAGNVTLWAWGDNSYGQLGDGTTTSSATPLPVLTGVIDVAAGRLHTLAVRFDGTVWDWGANFFGQVGRGTQTQFEPTPQPVPSLAGIGAVGAGDLHSLAVGQFGTVFGWGYDEYGQVGDGTTIEAQPNPQLVVGLTGIVSVAGGLNHSLALRANGRAWGWGSDLHGQLGDGVANVEPQPARENGLACALQLRLPRLQTDGRTHRPTVGLTATRARLSPSRSTGGDFAWR
jgi:alpha-tubulin suppressor-like RCC1 family protein